MPPQKVRSAILAVIRGARAGRTHSSVVRSEVRGDTVHLTVTAEGFPAFMTDPAHPFAPSGWDGQSRASIQRKANNHGWSFRISHRGTPATPAASSDAEGEGDAAVPTTPSLPPTGLSSTSSSSSSSSSTSSAASSSSSAASIKGKGGHFALQLVCRPFQGGPVPDLGTWSEERIAEHMRSHSEFVNLQARAKRASRSGTTSPAPSTAASRSPLGPTPIVDAASTKKRRRSVSQAATAKRSNSSSARSPMVIPRSPGFHPSEAGGLRPIEGGLDGTDPIGAHARGGSPPAKKRLVESPCPAPASGRGTPASFAHHHGHIHHHHGHGQHQQRPRGLSLDALSAVIVGEIGRARRDTELSEVEGDVLSALTSLSSAVL